ncbi:protein sprint isoform X2 [Spodoptera frugiperda]|uniref:Protein sprint isoform X2 n=1 Tax=Spodoptera frugiperda TaxID=7108 RepID=A0A9R0D2K3_SPOFR|nr:protein sprint isoform X2 [Spodoptera frugiperda]
MSIDQASPLVPIKPQVVLQNGAFIKNSHNRSSFCGVAPASNGNGTFKTFAVNRKSWSGNVTLPLQQFTPDVEQAPQLATFRSGTGTFPRNRERNNNTTNGILTPNGNSVQTFKGNEVRRCGSSNGRRYAEIGNWNKRNATFLEPHLQGVRRRDSRSSDSDHDERSTEDDERCLLRSSPRTRLPPPPPPPPDDDPPPLKPREFFERLQTQAMREAQERKHRSRDLPIKDSNQLFRPVDADGSLGDSLSQSRESLSSDGEGARGDCSSVDSSGSGSEEQPPCDIGLLERLIRTHPVWFLPGIQRAGAFHLLQGKEEGNFVVRQSSQPDTMAISVRLPADKGPYIEHYLIQASGGRIGLETSHNRFDNIPELIAHYSQCCDELPVQLQLPRPLREAKSRHQLSSLALLGQEFWGYPMANPKNNPNNPLSPCQLANGVVPMAVTPSDTGSSLSSFNASTRTNSREHILSPDKDQNVVLKMSPIDTSGSPPSQNSNLSTFKGKTAPSPPAKPNSAFIRAPRPTPPNTLNLMSSTAHITQPHTFPTTNTQHSPTQLNNVKTTPPPPPPRWAKPPFTKPSLSPKSEAFSPINKVSQNGNITVTTTVTFCVNNTQIHNHQINESIQSDRLQLTLASNAVNNNGSADSVFSIMDATKNIADSNGESQNMMHRMSPEGECINAMTASLHGSFKRQMTEQNNVEPGSPVEQQSQTNTSDSVDPIVNSLTKSGSTFAPNQLVSPNGTNSVTSGIFSPTSQINSPVSNDTISSKSGVFSPMSQTNKSEIFSPISRSSPISSKNVFSPTSNQSIISPVMGKDRDKVMSPNTNTASTTPSGRSRRSKHSHRKESRHYQESDILESPGVYCRSSLMDKVSDYEDIWGPESNSCSTFKPLKPENENNIHNGLMKSKRPDLLPDTLPKLNAAKSTQSILEKENIHLINSTESLNEKKTLLDGSLKKSFKGSNEIIATTNSKGEIIPKRPDRLNIAMNMNKKLTEEIEAVVKNRENYSIESMETIKIEDESVLNSMGEDSEKDNAGSPFYADPVDALKEAALPQVQRRKLLRVGMNLSQRYSEPPTQNHPYYPLRDMHSIEELSPSSPNTSSSVDNLMSLRSKPKMKPVQPPRIANKPTSGKNDQTWTVDSSWEFINKNDEGSNSENGTFPSLAEQECRLSAVDDGTQHLTVHQVVAQRLPDLRLNAEPTMLPEEVRSPPRASCYDNVHDLRPLSEQASDDGTVFSEPWDSSQWDGLIPPSNGHQLYDAEEPCEWESPLPRRGPTVATRAKSFRDRLDPLLAAGRVRALRGGRQTRGAGAALRAYALHLAQDKSTTFAQNIDNFIACTLDSKDTSPQVMMRNMRQFMSGMKNYLVKHGEREFEKEVEKERLKLKPTEFLNLDAILEGVMHRLVVRPLRARLYTLLAAWHSADVRRLHAAIERAQHATPLQLGIKESTKVPSSAVLAVISKHFLKMQEADSPLDKLENLLAAISVMFNAIRGERSVGADDLLPVLAWTIARSRLVCAELEAELMAGLLPAALLAGEGGYYLTALFSAVAVLKRLAPEPQPDSTTPWRRGSVDNNREQHSVAVVRVVLPDECRGSIRRVPVPCRPGARARDLCRALAHAAAITNPQDYALFALHDGHETMLNENDCPQEVMSEKTGQNFTLAYRRIDAKIAWPQQALLSYP